MAFALSIATTLWLASLVAVDPTVRSDDFLSVSCPQPSACYLLDAAGGLYFSPDGGRRLLPRARLERHGIHRIRFSGLLDGWGLDRKGGLWRSRNGGRDFEPFQSVAQGKPGCIPVDLAVGQDGRLWLACRDGALRQVKVPAAPGGRLEADTGPVAGLSLGPKGELVLAYTNGKVAYWDAPAGPVRRSRPLSAGGMGAVVLGAGRLIAAGCKGQVRFSADGGRGWNTPDSPAGLNTCLRPVGVLGEAWAVLAGLPGKLLLARLDPGLVAVLDAPPQRQWRDASPRGGELLLVGDGGAIGRLWLDSTGRPAHEQLSRNPASISDLQVLDRVRAVSSSADGSLQWTRDGGASWQPQAPSGTVLARIHFVDSQRGFGLQGVHEILGTLDGGKSWRPLGRWPDLALNDLFFLDARHGWAVGGAGALVRTTDGGANWTLDRVADLEKDLNRVQFLDRNTGFAVGGDQAVFRTRDGGKSWQRLVSGRGNLLALDFIDTRRGFVAGDDGLVMLSEDGGDSWTPRPVPAAEAIRTLAFSDALRGVAAGAGGLLFSTRDAGLTWRRVELHTRAALTDLACFAGSGRCLVGGERGLLRVGDPFAAAP